MHKWNKLGWYGSNLVIIQDEEDRGHDLCISVIQITSCVLFFHGKMEWEPLYNDVTLRVRRCMKRRVATLWSLGFLIPKVEPIKYAIIPIFRGQTLNYEGHTSCKHGWEYPSLILIMFEVPCDITILAFWSPCMWSPKRFFFSTFRG